MTEDFNELVREVENLSASQRALLKAQVIMNAELQELQAKTERSFQRVEHELSELAASVKITDQNVSALVTMFRQWLESKNGGQA